MSDKSLSLFGKVWSQHVMDPEQGPVPQGATAACGNSHTATNGASEVAHVLMAQTLWQRPPKRMRITIDPEWRLKLLDGRDNISLTASHADAITALQVENTAQRPWARPPRQDERKTR